YDPGGSRCGTWGRGASIGGHERNNAGVDRPFVLHGVRWDARERPETIQAQDVLREGRQDGALASLEASRDRDRRRVPAQNGDGSDSDGHENVDDRLPPHGGELRG